LVRQIALGFAHSMKEGRLKSEASNVALSFGFILAYSYGPKKRVTTLTPMSVPYWVVQVSGSESVVLSAITDKPLVLEFTENTALGSVRKIISETTEPREIPKAAEKALASLGSIERKTQYIKHLQQPEAFLRVGGWFEETEPTTKPCRPDFKADSQGALSISQQFQQLREAAIRRIAAMEELQKLTREKLGAQSDALANLVKAEKERWKSRVKSLEEIVGLETAQLIEKKKDALSALDARHGIELRALTAEFTRESSTVEQFFTQILDRIRESRLDIGRKGENIEAAMLEFGKLVDFLSKSVGRYADSVDEVKAKAAQILSRASTFAATVEEQKVIGNYGVDKYGQPLFYANSKEYITQSSTGGAALTITGAVDNELKLAMDALKGMEVVKVTADHPKTGTETDQGVRLNALLDQAKVKADAKSLVFTAGDGYTAELALADARACKDCLVAFSDDGKLKTVMPGMQSKFWVKDVIKIQVK